MKLNEQDSLLEKQQGNQRYVIRSSEKLKQIHKQKKQLSHSKQICNKSSNKLSSHQKQKLQSSSQWNPSSEYSNQSSVIILTPSGKHHHGFKPKSIPFLTQDNDQSSSIRDKNNNPKLMSSKMKTNVIKGCQNQQQQHCSIHSYQILSDEEKSCNEQIYASMVLVTEKKKSQVDASDDFYLKNQSNYIDLISSENKIITHESSPEDDFENSIQEYYIKSSTSSHINQKQLPQSEINNQRFASQFYNKLPLQPLEQNIIHNISTPNQLRNNDNLKNKDKTLCLNRTPYSSIKKRLFEQQHDFIGSQQENIDLMIREIKSAVKENNNKKTTFKSPQNSLVQQKQHFEGGNRQHIVEVLEVVKMKNSSAKLAKVSVFIENAAQLQIKYVHTLEIRQTHPELLIQYYEDAFDPYLLEINEIF